MRVETVRQLARSVKAVAGQQLAVDHDMVFVGPAFAQLFRIGGDQAGKARVLPVRQHAIEPGAIHQFGGRDGAQEIQCMGAVLKIAALPARLALLQVNAVFGAGQLRRVVHPVGQLLRRPGQIACLAICLLQGSMKEGAGFNACRLSGRLVGQSVVKLACPAVMRRRQQIADWRWTGGGFAGRGPFVGGNKHCN